MGENGGLQWKAVSRAKKKKKKKRPTFQSKHPPFRRYSAHRAPSPPSLLLPHPKLEGLWVGAVLGVGSVKG